MKLLAEGAEACVYVHKGEIIKKRCRKGYRINEIDRKLRLFRTKREGKILKKLEKAGVAVPKLTSAGETSIGLELIKGRRLRDVLSESNHPEICRQIGAGTGLMHSNGVIHGDLTTSNMILSEGKLYFIDFGLAFCSDKIEDRAVDLHLLKQALNASHGSIAGKCFSAAMAEYGKKSTDVSEVMKRLETVESRGRYKGKKKP